MRPWRDLVHRAGARSVAACRRRQSERLSVGQRVAFLECQPDAVAEFECQPKRLQVAERQPQRVAESVRVRLSVSQRLAVFVDVAIEFDIGQPFAGWDA
jgi:hypothetical protein